MKGVTGSLVAPFLMKKEWKRIKNNKLVKKWRGLNLEKDKTGKIKVNVVYGDKRLVDCMKSVIEKHRNY